MATKKYEIEAEDIFAWVEVETRYFKDEPCEGGYEGKEYYGYKIDVIVRVGIHMLRSQVSKRDGHSYDLVCRDFKDTMDRLGFPDAEFEYDPK